MAFDNVIGQTRVKTFFQNALSRGRMSHAYLFVGQRGVGKEAMAFELARALLCSAEATAGGCGTCTDCVRVSQLAHPDLTVIFPAPASAKEPDRRRIFASLAKDPYQRLELWANPSITIERIREVRRFLAYRTPEGRARAIIMVDADRLTQEAANALLKILEEPPAKTYLILTSAKPNLMLSTIASRCQLVKFDPLSASEIEAALIQKNGLEPDQARLLARLASGSYRKALEYLDEDFHSLRHLSLEFFRKSVTNPYVQLLFVEELLHNLRKDSKKIKDLLTLLLFWFRDAMVVAQSRGQGSHRLVNYDQEEILQRFVKSFPNADLYGAVLEIERSLELMERNVQLNLILIVLLNKLSAYVRR